jgi:hypothetical protein
VSTQERDVEGVIRPDWFYSTDGLYKALPIGERTVAEWVRTNRIEPTKCGRGYGFMGHEIIAALRKDK